MAHFFGTYTTINKVYSDYYCVQNGRKNTPTATWVLITFYKAYINTNYVFIPNANADAVSGGANWYGQEVLNSTHQRTVASTYVKGYGTSGAYENWVAMGYINPVASSVSVLSDYSESSSSE